ncbi:MAG: acyltransferase family protein, partial [Gaiellaceae bacterium]
PALVAWTFIYLVIVRILLLHEPVTIGIAIADIVEARVYPHLYFLWLIAGLYLVAPVLAAFLHRGGRRRATYAAAGTLCFTLLVVMTYSVLAFKGAAEPIHVGALTFWIPYVGYFLAGYALSLWRVHGRWLVLAVVGVLVFGAASLAAAAWPTELAVFRAVSPPDYLGVVVAALSICVFVVAVAFLDRIRVGPRLSRFVVTLSEASFGVFLVHLIVMLVPYELLESYHARTSVFSAAIAYLFVLVVSFAISLGARRVPGLRLIF